MARRESNGKKKTATTQAAPARGGDRAKRRGFKTGERERRLRADRKRLCRLGRDYAIVPDTGSLDGGPAGGRTRRR